MGRLSEVKKNTVKPTIFFLKIPLLIEGSSVKYFIVVDTNLWVLSNNCYVVDI